ncbi:AAA family ATPase [Candidatus Entotheonella palauensis]|uniref:AAA family ATPase n=1 Tax=Candidatus Entotheonella palauensis TaxID=93172 RepID=UPI0015C447F2|nr:ATP-binding protein [Candidatus Entotheonella palauensis]
MSADQVRKAVDLSGLNFNTTADLEPRTVLAGQERATQALQMGIEMAQPGYNIFVSDVEGAGARTQITTLLQERAAAMPAPGDWVYVHNFRQPDQPCALALEPGQGCRLTQDMERLVTHLRETLPKAFQQEAFENEQRELGEKYEQQVRQIQQGFSRFAQEQGFRFQVDPAGNAIFIPMRDGEPMSQEALASLSDDERQALDKRQSDVLHTFRSVMQQQRQLMQQLAEDIKGIERNFCAAIIAPLINELCQQYPQASVHQYLAAVQEHMLSHLELFKAGGSPPQSGAMPFQLTPDGQESFLEYRVNVVVDNSDTQGAPVLIEDTPTYKNLFGTIERVVDPHGRVVTNFTRIKAGSLLKASGGYLLFNLEDALTEPFVWKTLKRTLQSTQVKIEAYDPFAFFTISAMQPEAVPMRTKLVVMGPP